MTNAKRGPFGVAPKHCFKRPKSPFWHCKFQIKGLEIYRSTGCEHASEAAAFVDALKTKIRAEQSDNQNGLVLAGVVTPTKGSRITWGDALEKYYAEVGQDKSNKSDSLRTSVWLRELGADRWIDDMGHDDFARYRAARLRCVTRRGNLLAPTSANREIAYARQVWRFIKRAGYRMPVIDPEWGQIFDGHAERAAARKKELSSDQEQRLFDALKDVNPCLIPLVKFAILSGCRKHAIIDLTWDKVDWTNEHFTVYLKGKGIRKIEHSVPITPRIKELLEAQPKVPGTNKVFTYICRKATEGVRINGERYPFTIGGWKNDWARALKLAGIEDFHFHDLRHTSATRLVRQTRNIKVAQQLLGHQSIVTTARYAHADLSDVRRAMSETEARSSQAIEANNRKLRKGE